MLCLFITLVVSNVCVLFLIVPYLCWETLDNFQMWWVPKWRIEKVKLLNNVIGIFRQCFIDKKCGIQIGIN